MTQSIEGVLEIDADRGVIYFHAAKTGQSVLRICRLPVPIPDVRKKPGLLDITHMHGVSWGDDLDLFSRPAGEQKEAHEEAGPKPASYGQIEDLCVKLVEALVVLKMRHAPHCDASGCPECTKGAAAHEAYRKLIGK